MGLFDKNMLDSIVKPPITIGVNPIIKPTRKQQEQIKEAKQNVQKKVEDVAYEQYQISMLNKHIYGVCKND